ncbi:hypothetical protein U8335_17220 [Roseiconus lacunae]|uniref:hypothetical protein n=1 Tax=Roseiconus lacunae TaxID=2605694 RepID=UPI003091F7DD|nr:hypothetical protein U8335_17220 [Stieleria sp. HD01]
MQKTHRLRANGFRSGYTLLELVSAIAAATLLLLILATSIAVSTHTVELTGHDIAEQRTRDFATRLQNDLRFATRFQFVDATRFEVDRLDARGETESVVYQSDADGLKRIVDGRSQLIANRVLSTAATFDHYDAGEQSRKSRLRPRIRDYRTASTDGSGASMLTIDVPEGARDGDLLLLVCCFKNTFDVMPFSNQWTRSHYTTGASLGICADYRLKQSTTPSTLTVGYLPYGDVAAIMLAIENTDAPWPFGWSSSARGSSSELDAGTHPSAIENSSSIDAETLNLNLFAASGTPFYDRTCQLPGFTPLNVLLGSPGSYGACTLATTFRSGPLPPMHFTPRVRHDQPTDWLTLAIEINGGVQ